MTLARDLGNWKQSPLHIPKAYPHLGQTSQEEEAAMKNAESEGVLREPTKSPRVVSQKQSCGFKKALMRGQKTTGVWFHLVRTKNLTMDVAQPAHAPTQTQDTQ